MFYPRSYEEEQHEDVWLCNCGSRRYRHRRADDCKRRNRRGQASRSSFRTARGIPRASRSRLARRVATWPRREDHHQEASSHGLRRTQLKRLTLEWPREGAILLRPYNDDARHHSKIAAAATSRVVVVLSLPVADAARSARPHLNPGGHRLGIERIVVLTRQPDLPSWKRLRAPEMCDPWLRLGMRLGVNFGPVERDLGARHVNSGVTDMFGAGLRALAAMIRLGLDGNGRKRSRRTERLRRKHGLRKVEAQKLVGTVLIRAGRTARCQQQSASAEHDLLQDHRGLLRWTEVQQHRFI